MPRKPKVVPSAWRSVFSKVLSMSAITITRVDYANPLHAQALVDLLDDYARDPMGGAHALDAEVKQRLVAELAARPWAYSVMAWEGGQAVGLVNALEGFSTFAAKPLVNVHDVTVLASHRGQGIAGLMLAEVEAIARARGACKLTLEILSGNRSAAKAYERIGFALYALTPEAGTAQFMQKWL